MNSAFTTHGAFSWTELMTSDLDKAVAYYRDVLGWTLEDAGIPGVAYTLIKVGGEAVGGIMALTPEMAGITTHWHSYVTVDNVDERTARVSAAGGTVIRPPMNIPNVGRFAVVQDPTGGVLSLITYDTPAGG